MSDDNKVVSLAEVKQDNSLRTPKQMLEEIIDQIDKEIFKAKKMVVLYIDESDPDNNYSVGYRASNISMSEAIALVELSKITFMQEMGYINHPNDLIR